MDRVEHIDIFRAFGIILMVMGHIGFGVHFDHFIHAFHMPMFFLISGMFFHMKNEPGAFLLKKAKSLLLPYFVFGVFHYLVWMWMNRPEISAEPLLHLLFINTDGLPIAGALWFLTALFFSEVIYNLVSRYISGGLLRHIMIAAVALFGCTAAMIFPFRLPYAMDAAFVGVGLMHIGCVCRKHKNRLKCLSNLRMPGVLVLSLIAIVLIFLNGYINMRTGDYAIIPLFWVNAVLAAIVGIHLAKYVVKHAPRWLRGYLSSVGRNSMVYLCLNQLVILVVNKFAEMLLPSSFIAVRVVILAVSLAVLFVLEKLMMHSKLCVLLGKPV